MYLDEKAKYACYNEANELVHKFFGLTCKDRQDDKANEGLTNAKRCAKIVCNKIIEQYVSKEKSYTVLFYKEVKKQIAKI